MEDPNADLIGVEFPSPNGWIFRVVGSWPINTHYVVAHAYADSNHALPLNDVVAVRPAGVVRAHKAASG